MKRKGSKEGSQTRGHRRDGYAIAPEIRKEKMLVERMIKLEEENFRRRVGRRRGRKSERK
jgi:hypothetical protein